MQAWDQLEGEGDRAYAGFIIFRDLGARRTIVEAARLFYDAGKPKASASQSSRFMAWSAKYHWQDRAREYDKFLADAAVEARIKAITEMNERQAQYGRGLQAVAMNRIRTLSPDDLTASEALRWVVEGAKLERLANGQATARDEIGSAGNSISISLDQVLAKVERLTSGPDGSADVPEESDEE